MRFGEVICLLGRGIDALRHLDSDDWRADSSQDDSTTEGKVMPDISMCHDTLCPLAKQCRRSPEVSDPHGLWQSWLAESPREADNTCHLYWPVAPDDVSHP